MRKAVSVGLIFFSVLLFHNKTQGQFIDTAVFRSNNLVVPINNIGEIGNIYLDNNSITSGAKFFGFRSFHTSGFLLAGLHENYVWTTGAFSTIHVEDMFPGPVGANPYNDRAKIYILKSSDEDFGNSWQEWKTAVELGAAFYDGDGDDEYNPVDLNGNGQWDYSEDRPDLIGDETYWCVYNDGKPAHLRAFHNIDPKGIEIKQTLFAFDALQGENYNSFFIRYRIENKGTVEFNFDSVYFGIAHDADIGDSNDDQAGCDVEFSTGYTYHSRPDHELIYGENPPAVLVDFLQGPHVYIPNETYLDIDSNGLFEIKKDIPLDSAILMRGQIMGKNFIPGSKNLPLDSFTPFIKGNYFNDPYDEVEVWNYLHGGQWKDGSPINIEDFGNGDQLGSLADSISKKFIFSGDPVEQTGWLSWQNNGHDYRMLFSSGPTSLKVNQPVEIIAAVILYRGSDYFNSLKLARELDEKVQAAYDNNFIVEPTYIQQYGTENSIDVELFQNYPNPFNPTTTIDFDIKEKNLVQLKVFNSLGEEIVTLVNSIKNKGRYRVNFEASKFSSGIYFYRLLVGEYSEIKKMILIK